MSAPKQPNYYEILSLSPSAIDDAYQKGGETSSTQLIKRVYRRALLSHHPDKQQKASHTTTTTTNTNTNVDEYQYTIDQISQAYAILSSPSQRALYDRQVKLSNSPTDSSSSSPYQGQGQGQGRDLFQTGIENIDLDDLDSFDTPDGQTKWYRPCRCGNSRGYLFSESDLEEAADLGELMVGCADCSLWLRVHFAVLEEAEEDEDEDDEVQGGQTLGDNCEQIGDIRGQGGNRRGCCGINGGNCSISR